MPGSTRIWMLLPTLLASCSGTLQSSGGLDLSKLSPGCFRPVSSAPVIRSGDFFAGSTWNDPSVLYEDGQFTMYLSSDTSFDHDVKIYRLVSADGLSWVLSPSAPVFSRPASGWDSASVETPSVVRFNGKYHLFYTGYATSYSDPYDFKIGYATSADGLSWTREASYIAAPTDPRNGTPSYEFNQYIVAEPGALVHDGRLHVYFTAVGVRSSVNSSLQVIGRISSSDGQTWSAQAEVLQPDQSIYPRGSGYVGYSTPAPIVLGNEFHLFYDVAQELPAWTQVKLHHAKSLDGASGWIQDPGAIHSRGDAAWSADEVRSPSPVLVGSKLYLFYAGHVGTTAGIGLSVCDLSP